MKQTITRVKNGYKEIITADAHTISELIKNSGFKFGFGGKEGEFQAYKIHYIEQSDENKMTIRQAWNDENPEYTCCVACGRALHANNKDDHFKSQFGIIGPECFKKYAAII